MEHKIIKHSFKPIYNSESKILILGTIPSPKSRKENMYYGNPNNRFWKIISIIFNVIFTDNESKINFCLQNHIAIWDVLKECEIVGALDSSIIKPIPNNIKALIDNSQIQQVFTTGKTAYGLYKRFFGESIYLPSTSPANCSYSLEKLIQEYEIIKEYL